MVRLVCRPSAATTWQSTSSAGSQASIALPSAVAVRGRAPADPGRYGAAKRPPTLSRYWISAPSSTARCTTRPVRMCSSWSSARRDLAAARGGRRRCRPDRATGSRGVAEGRVREPLEPDQLVEDAVRGRPRQVRAPARPARASAGVRATRRRRGSASSARPSTAADLADRRRPARLVSSVPMARTDMLTPWFTLKTEMISGFGKVSTVPRKAVKFRSAGGHARPPYVPRC